MKRIPFIGVMSFVILYLYAATLYPGGSQANPNTLGFSWTHNYWCNLLNSTAINGQTNPARPFAILAMVLLCVSLSVFFIRFAQTFVKNSFWKQVIQLGGICSMLFAVLIFTPYHDLMTILSSFFGLFVVLGIIKTLYQSPLKKFKISGIFCIVLLALNNYIYYTHHYIEALPVLQKITFIIVLIWVLGLNYEINQERKIWVV